MMKIAMISPGRSPVGVTSLRATPLASEVPAEVFPAAVADGVAPSLRFMGAAAVPPSTPSPQGISVPSLALSLAAPSLSSIAVPEARVRPPDGGLDARAAAAPMVARERPTFNVYAMVRDFYLGEMLACCAQNRASSPSVDRWREDLAEARKSFVEQTAPVVHDYLVDVMAHEFWSGSRFDGTWQQHAPDWCRTILSENHDDRRDYTGLKEAIAARHLTNAEMGGMAREFFLLPGWRAQYGGEPWARIADLVGSLQPDRAGVWLDRVFGTEHNTSSVFNKGGTGLAEIDRPDATLRAMLDYKRNSDDPHAFAALAANALGPRDTSPFTRLLRRAEVLGLTPQRPLLEPVTASTSINPLGEVPPLLR